MLNLRNSNQDPPVDLYDLKESDDGNNEINSLTKEPSNTLLMGDEVISTTPKRENNEFIKCIVDDVVLILRESEVTSVCDDSECDMPTPLPTTDVLRIENKAKTRIFGFDSIKFTNYSRSRQSHKNSSSIPLERAQDYESGCTND
uniref:Uncharacterized protein n=1 Tax=Tanacetum cinerariifolium TaxID=118510 RepID=A0A6L2M0U3_TANCI|nr:hypothetical protein [Tanacetum cinerariifolium]